MYTSVGTSRTLDVDFAVCTDWRSVVRDAAHRYSGVASVAIEDQLSGSNNLRNYTLDPDIFADLRAGTAALVLPVFEYVKQEDGVDQATFPRDKDVRRTLLVCCPRH